MPLIAIIIFAFAVLFIGVNQEQIETSQAQGTALQQMTAQSAKEFAEFIQASVNYIQSVGLPLSGTALTVNSLQNVNLLPSSFPTQTPFGQTLVAEYVSDPSNPAALDVVVHTTGTMNAALLQQAGVSQGSEAAVQYDTANAAQNQVPSNIAGSTGQTLGILNGSLLTSLGASNTISLQGSINTNQPEVAEYILSPDQYGYWIIGGAISGQIGTWEPISGWNPSTDDANMGILVAAYSPSPSFSSQGFSLTCPSIAINLSTLSDGSFTGNNDTIYQSFDGDPSQSPVFCIPAYKGQITTVQFPDAQTQTLGGTVYEYEIHWNGQYFENPVENYDWVDSGNGVSYVNSSDIVGLNNNLYATGYFMSPYNMPSYPSNEASPMPMPNTIGAIGFSITVNTPQNTEDTYQIEMDGGSLFTGSGCPESLVDPWTLGMATYNVWATDQGSNQNLCGSQETFWTDWHAVKDSSNTSSIPVTQSYESGGSNYSLSFNVGTPLVN